MIVTDLSMPGLSGLDVLGKLKAEHIDSKVVVLTMHNDAERATQALKAGASAFLLEGVGRARSWSPPFTRRYRAVSTSRRRSRGRSSNGWPTPAAGQAPELTPRQLDVLRLIVKGQRMKEIAAALQLSTRTVETHKYEMMQVLGVHSTAELVRYAIEQRLIGD